jgi:CBS domain-containing protein
MDQTTPTKAAGDSTRSTLKTTRVREVMTRKLRTVRPDDSPMLASQMMLWASVRHLLVVDGVKLIGVLSERDLLRLADPRAGAKVTDLMTGPPVVIDPNATLEDACARMAALKIDCLPVVADDDLIGIITTSDVLAERGRLLHKGRAAHGSIPTAGTVMRKALAFVHPDTTLLGAIEKLLLVGIRHLPVVDANHVVVGMLSDRDVREAVGDIHDALYQKDRSSLEETRVEAVMSSTPTTIGPRASILELANALIDERVGALPVVDDDERLLGIVSYVDLLAYAFGRKPG